MNVGEVNSFQGFEDIYIEMNEKLDQFGCLALRDDYHAYDTLPGPNTEKGKLFLIGNIVDLKIKISLKIPVFILISR